jgi:hypothetical protein
VLRSFKALASLNDIVPAFLGGATQTDNAAVCDLDRRLHFRAVSNALSGLVESFSERAETKSSTGESEFAELLQFIFAKWAGNKSFSVGVSVTLTILATEMICLIVTLVRALFPGPITAARIS